MQLTKKGFFEQLGGLDRVGVASTAEWCGSAGPAVHVVNRCRYCIFLNFCARANEAKRDFNNNKSLF